MSITIGRTKTDLISTPGSPGSISANASASGSIDLTVGGVVAASLTATVITGGSAPTTNPTIAFALSYDGTNYATVQTVTIASPGTSTTYSFSFEVPPAAQKAQVTITNGATNAITAWCEGDVLTVS